MAVQPHLYQLFHHRPSAAQTSKDALVSAFWRRLFPRNNFGQNARLDRMFFALSTSPEQAIPLCPYYFDQVTSRLPTRDLVTHREHYNIQLHCFNSWADIKQERQRATKQHRRQNLSYKVDAQPCIGIRLGLLCQQQNPNTGRSISTKEYIHMMYGLRC